VQLFFNSDDQKASIRLVVVEQDAERFQLGEYYTNDAILG
jgi:hypothetical protein